MGFFVGHFYYQPKQMHCFWGKSLKKLLAQHLLLVCCPPKEVPFNDSPQGDWLLKDLPPTDGFGTAAVTLGSCG